MKLVHLTYNKDKQELRKQYRELAKKLHPDKPGGSKESFQQLQEEFIFLMNDEISDESKQRTPNKNHWTHDDIRDFFDKNRNIEEAREVYKKLMISIDKSKMNWFNKLLMKGMLENFFVEIYKTKP